jgi:endonuclease-3
LCVGRVAPDVTDRGTYTLLVDLAEPAAPTVGALGERSLPAGRYAYTGSALGTGGFARLDRHREVAAGDRDVRHWHVDYLLGLDAASVVGDVRSPGADVECAVARRLAARDDTTPVPGFGASDCDCDTHLVRAADADALRRAVSEARDAATATGP